MLRALDECRLPANQCDCTCTAIAEQSYGEVRFVAWSPTFMPSPAEHIKPMVANWLDLETSLLKEALREIAPKTHGRLLDVGCGEKPYEPIFRPYVSAYIGVEYQGTFEQTAASGGATKPDAYYDGKHLPFEDQSFDTVASFQVLEHTPDPEGLIREMARVAKPGGLVIVTAPFSFRLHEEPHDYFRFTPYGLRILFEKAGVDVNEIHARGSMWSLIGHKLNTFLAFDVARAHGAAMEMGSSRQERRTSAKTRVWTFPVVVPLMFGISGGARILDRVLNVPSEALGYIALGTKR